MSEYWKSVPRKFCEFCKCWLTDNKPSVEFHERGKRHQENVAKKLAELRKKGKKDYEAQKKIDAQFQKMNEAAMKAYMKDIANDPMLKKELDEMQKEEAAAAEATEALLAARPEPAAAVRGTKSKNSKACTKKEVDAISSDVPFYPEVGPSNRPTPYGQWVTIESSSIKAPVDLQLPEKKETIEYKVVSQISEDSFKFKEKTLSSISAASLGVSHGSSDATFKKRKFNAGSFTRNMRRKETNDAD